MKCWRTWQKRLPRALGVHDSSEMSAMPDLKLIAILRWSAKDWLTIVGFTFLINLLMLTPAFYMLQIYDRVLISGSALTLIAISLVAIFLFWLIAMADWFRSRLLIRVGQLIDLRLAPLVFRAAYADKLSSGSSAVLQRLADLTQIRQFLTGPGFLNLMDMPWIPIYVGVLFLLHPVLGVFAIVVSGIQLLQIYVSQRHVGSVTKTAEKETQAADSLTARLGRGREVVVTMGMRLNVAAKWSELQSVARKSVDVTSRRNTGWTAASKWLRYTQQSAALGLGALLAIRGEISAGAMIAASILTTRALAPLDGWAQAHASAVAAQTALERLRHLIAEFSQWRGGLPTSLGAEGAADTRDIIKLSDVSATVKDREKPILSDINLTLRAGEITVVQGASGSGKTSLLRVLLGVQQIAAGQIQMAPHLIQNPQAIGYLPQSIQLFDGTVAQNIARFAKPVGSSVIAAAQSVGLHEVVQRLEHGYDTHVGPNGQFLSGGQRQRIGLARALYENPAFIVLDEPNSQLESAAEQDLYRALIALRASGACVVLASHRPGAAAIADQTVDMQSGEIVTVTRKLQSAGVDAASQSE